MIVSTAAITSGVLRYRILFVVKSLRNDPNRVELLGNIITAAWKFYFPKWCRQPHYHRLDNIEIFYL